MISVAVIIPYYQREKGILRRALENVEMPDVRGQRGDDLDAR